jgi:hypothetical protein
MEPDDGNQGVKEMETKFESKKAPATQPKTESTGPVADAVVAKIKKPRAEPVSFKDKVNIMKLVSEGKGTVADLVGTGVPERTAKVALKTLLKEKMIKQSYVTA